MQLDGFCASARGHSLHQRRFLCIMPVVPALPLSPELCLLWLSSRYVPSVHCGSNPAICLRVASQFIIVFGSQHDVWTFGGVETILSYATHCVEKRPQNEGVRGSLAVLPIQFNSESEKHSVCLHSLWSSGSLCSFKRFTAILLPFPGLWFQFSSGTSCIKYFCHFMGTQSSNSSFFPEQYKL